MRNILLLTLFCVLHILDTPICVSCNYINALRAAYQERRVCATRFMNLFPDSGNKFRQTFGYSEERNGEVCYSPLYKDAYQYIQTYFQLCDSIGTDEEYVKVIKLASELEWQVDGVNYFQYELRNRIIDRASIFSTQLLYQLHEQPTDIVMQFWNFILSGTPDRFQNNALDETFQLLSNVVSNDPYLYNILRSAYNKRNGTDAPRGVYL